MTFSLRKGARIGNIRRNGVSESAALKSVVKIYVLASRRAVWMPQVSESLLSFRSGLKKRPQR